tara:strand:+ start:78 stop:473 length:396 start_codon:yes stop_codon:yes gene_type:complete
MDMSLYKIAAATTEPAFADVQSKLDQSFGLFMDVTIPMRERNRENDALRQGMQQTVSAAGAALGTYVTGGWNQVAGMMAAPAPAQQVIGPGLGRNPGPVQQAPQYGGAMASDPAMSSWFSAGPMATQMGGW